MDCARSFSRRAAPCCSSGLCMSWEWPVGSRLSSRSRRCAIGGWLRNAVVSGRGPRHGLGAGRRQTPLQLRQPDGFGLGPFPRPLLLGVGGLDANGPVGLVVNPVLNSVEGEEMAASATHLVGGGDEFIGGFHQVSPARV